MCGTCGCGHDELRIEGHSHDRHHSHHSHQGTAHHHEHPHGNHGDAVHGVTTGRQSSAAAPSTAERLIAVEQDILAKNRGYAEQNRAHWESAGLLAINLISSPGAGKTALLVETLKALRNEIPLSVIEGDQETSNDADRIRATGVPAVQINTGRGCHLDAHAVGHAADELPTTGNGILFIENVGNLVCPAGFDLGEGRRVVILSVTEGTDKPIKYPDAFASAHILVLSKIDLLPYVDFDEAAAIEMARRVNPTIEVIRVSTKHDGGIEPWLAWLRRERRAVLAREAERLESRLTLLRTELSARA